jgi:hypothetical protein
MAISNQSTRYVVTLGIGATSTTFAFDYLLIANIKVYFDGVLKAYGTHYTIVNKTVTFVTPLVAITKVSVISSQPYGSIFDFTTPEEWVASTINNMKNELALQIEQVRDQSVLVGDSDSSSSAIELLNDAILASSSSATASANSASASATSATLAQNWAISTSIVQALDYSSKQWATKLVTTVDGVNFSSKYNANLAQDWANKATDVLPGFPSAKTWAQTASATAIPAGSITNVKLSTTDQFEFFKISNIQPLNCYFGHGALLNNTANGCNGFGYNTLLNNTGIGCNAFGTTTLDGLNTGFGNNAFGNNSLINNTLGQRNNAFGQGVLPNCTTGSNNTGIGDGALAGLIGGSNCTGIGANSLITSGNQVQLGDSFTTTYVFGTVQNRSDRRDKTAIQDTKLGLDFINKLHPVDYKYDYRDSYRPEIPKCKDNATDDELVQFKLDMAKYCENSKLSNITSDGSKARTRLHHGLIAQEVQEVIQSTGIDFGGFQDHSLEGGDDVLSIGYDELIAPMIKAIQELTNKIIELEKKLS